MAEKKGLNFFELLTEAAENSLRAAKLFQETMNGDTPPASYLVKFKEMETAGDQITHAVFKRLNEVFITPIDREDIMELAVKIDDVIDGIEATIARFDYLNVSFTDKYMVEFSDMIVASCEHIVEAMNLLSKKKYMPIAEHAMHINNLENEGDRLMREGIRQIFINPKDPYHDFKLKELYERLEETTDACEDVADILGSIVLRYA